MSHEHSDAWVFCPECPDTMLVALTGAVKVQATSRPLYLGRQPQVLSGRQRDVLELVADGLPIVEIGDKLGLSEGTVKRHVLRACRRLGVHNQAAAVAQAMRSGELT